jgi:hypothetical protein
MIDFIDRVWNELKNKGLVQRDSDLNLNSFLSGF